MSFSDIMLILALHTLITLSLFTHLGACVIVSYPFLASAYKIIMYFIRHHHSTETVAFVTSCAMIGFGFLVFKIWAFVGPGLDENDVLVASGADCSSASACSFRTAVLVKYVVAEPCCNIFHDEDDCSCLAVERRAFVVPAGAPAKPFATDTSDAPSSSVRAVSVAGPVPAPAFATMQDCSSAVASASLPAFAAASVATPCVTRFPGAFPAASAPSPGASAPTDASARVSAAAAITSAATADYLVAVLPFLAVYLVALLALHQLYLTLMQALEELLHAAADDILFFLAVVLSGTAVAAIRDFTALAVRAQCVGPTNFGLFLVPVASPACSGPGENSAASTSRLCG
ncbi:hypothetical protein [Parasitella parasitica]|uniref:Uncharacterized protein n=1 Tax=Parasitella parasitica TaxID=35722 RepID=A0A0B7NAT1_9FUNG|nr:hypothetical protein [Parasitella parasitica]